ncbi:MAG TPA: forespore capture DNA-binding protein RefZ [Chondromyces sp.]|nr:forespore capture DNA-binding protein RefZ [Chondromyces sp.]
MTAPATNQTKEAILESAVLLFTIKGYNGTSVRDIANKAGVNAANISYYFKGKQGLLEACVTNFFEPYLSCLEQGTSLRGVDTPKDSLKRAVRSILLFQRENHLLARFVWRELSIDSQLTREISSTYLVKEQYLFNEILDKGKKSGYFINLPNSLILIQLKAMLSMPFLNSQYLREVWHMYPQEKYFIDKYMILMERWIDETLSVRPSDLIKREVI